MTDEELWAAFADEVAALDEGAAIHLGKTVADDSAAREKFESDRQRLTEFLRNDDWEGIANEFYDGIDPRGDETSGGEVGEAGSQDRAGSRDVQADAGQKPVEQHEAG